MIFEVRHTVECPHTEDTLRMVKSVVDSLVPGGKMRRVTVATLDEARRLKFHGSPTVIVDGLDVAGTPPGEPSLGERLYDGAAGVPPRWMVEATVLRSLQPSRFLFLCVANSARSQMAEGIARSLAPRSVNVLSAGSRPTAVRPEAIRALEEIGLDISGHGSKSMDDIDSAAIDVVVTLCADEICPAFLGRALHLHWGLPDPGLARGDDEAVLDAFRQTRDELRRRLSHLFKGWVW